MVRIFCVLNFLSCELNSSVHNLLIVLVTLDGKSRVLFFETAKSDFIVSSRQTGSRYLPDAVAFTSLFTEL